MNKTSLTLSRRDYDYIESVHALSSRGWPARVKDIAATLKVAPPTAVEFLDKLVSRSLVERGPSGYRLSKAGIACFNGATRTHRLFETLLTRSGIPLEEACRISSGFGSTINEADLERLCAHMSHPEKCPHGKPIPVGPRHV